MKLNITALKIATVLGSVVLGACATPRLPQAPAGPKPGTVRMVSSSEGHLVLQAEAVPGKCYQLQKTASLVNPVWKDVGQPIVAENSILELTDAAATDSSAFYRIKPLD